MPILLLISLSGLAPLLASSLLEPSADMRSMLPDDDTSWAEYETFAQTFGSDRVLALVLIRPGGFFDPERLEQLSALCDELEAIPWVRTVESITHTTSVASRAGVMEAGPLFRDPPFDDDQVERGKREILANPAFVGNLVSVNGGAVAVMVFLEERSVPREVLRHLPEAVEGDPVAYGEAGRSIQQTLRDVGLQIARGEIEGDPEQLRIDALTELAGTEIEGGAPLAALIDRLSTEAEQSIAHYDTEALETVKGLMDKHGARLTQKRHLVGAPDLRLGLMYRMAVDVKQSVIASVVLVLLLAWLGLRDPFRIPLPLAATTMGILWSLGILALLKMPLDQVTVAAMCPMAAVPLAASMLLCTESTPSRTSIYGVLGSGLFLAVLGVALWFHPIEAVRRFGTVLMVGSLCGSIAPVLIVPLSLIGAPSTLPPPDPRQRRRWLIMTAVMVGLGGVIGLERLEPGVDHVDSLLPRDPMAKSYRAIEGHLSGMEAFRLHLETDTVDRFKDPEVLEAVRALQVQIDGMEPVDATLSYVDFIDAIYGALDPDRETRLPTTRTLVGQLLLLFGSPETMAPYVAPDYDQAAVTVRTHVGGGAGLRRLVKDIEAACEEQLPADIRATPRGELLLTQEATSGTARGLLVNAARGLMLALALLMGTTRRIRPFLRLAIPMTLVTAASLGAASLGTTDMGPMTVAVPWVGLAVGMPLALARSRGGAPLERDWLVIASVGVCFTPLIVSTLRFDAAVGIGLALGSAVAAVVLWADAGTLED